MEYQDVIHPEEEYRQFGAMIIQAIPQLEEEMEDQDVINLYNQLRQEVPEATLPELAKMLPKMLPEMEAKFQEQVAAPAPENAPDKMAALKALGGK